MAWCMMRPSPSWKMKIEGKEKFDPSKPTIFICNHQSFMDIPFAFQLPWKMKWVVKHSMTYIPVMGWMVKLTGHLTINRSSKSALKKLSRLVKPLNDQVPVMIFPEGTRSLDGEIKMFKNGAFLLALEHGFMIQPIVIDGAHSALASGSKLFNPKASFKMRVLDSIDPNNFDSMTALRDHSREILIDAHEELKKT
jgi:1-acyl-sn-glycerol-3-phosphate acyltransferase